MNTDPEYDITVISFFENVQGNSYAALHRAIDAYTINGARMLNRDRDTGSLEVGKSADLIVLDRDILALADSGHVEDVAKTRVLATWFQGKKVRRQSLEDSGTAGIGKGR